MRKIIYVGKFHFDDENEMNKVLGSLDSKKYVYTLDEFGAYSDETFIVELYKYA